MLLVLWVCAATVGLALLGAAADPPPDPRLEKVLMDWRNRRERVKTVRYCTSGETIIPKGTARNASTGQLLGPDEPPHDIVCPKSVTLLLDFTTNRHRLDVEEQFYSASHRQLMPKRVTTTVFDSNDLRTSGLRPEGAPENLKAPNDLVVKGNMRGSPFTSDYWPFFLGHGIVPLTTEQHILPGRLAVAPQKETFHIHGEGVLDNRSCLVLRSKTWDYGNVGFDELWVDPARESAVVREAAYVNGTIYTDIQVDYQETREGWLPHGWTISTSLDGRLVSSVQRMQVDELDIDPAISDADFHADIKPGDIVMQASVPGSPDQITAPKPDPAKMYHVSPDGSWHELIGGAEARPLWVYFIWGGVILLLIVGGACALVLWRRRYRRTP
jgi:hypothetical protein